MRKFLVVVFAISVAGCSMRSSMNRQNASQIEATSGSKAQMQVTVERNPKQPIYNLKETAGVYRPAIYRSRIVTLRQIAVSRDGKILAVAGEGVSGKANHIIHKRSFLLWFDARSGKGLRSIWNYRVGSLLFSPDGKWLITGGKKMRWWNVATGKLLYTAKTQADSMTFSSDGKTLAVADYAANRLDIWQMSTPQLQKRFGFMADPGRISFSPDGRQVKSSTGLIYDVALDNIKRLPQGSNYGEFSGRGIASPDGALQARVAVSYTNGLHHYKMTVTSTRINQELWSVPFITSSPFVETAFSPNSQQIVLLNSTSYAQLTLNVLARLHDAKNGKVLHTIRRKNADDILEATAAAFTPDGKTVILAGTGLDNAVKIVRLNAK